MKIEQVLPEEIEKKSFEIIESELMEKLPEELAPVIKRVIHTTADFDYAKNLYFSEGVVDYAIKLLREGATIVTDTNMAKAGINKMALKKLNCNVECFMADEDVAELAKKNGTTRAVASVIKASSLKGNVIMVAGNAPTALIQTDEMMKEGTFKPALVIGVPVGFVNVVAAKELIVESGVPCIVARGRKGGSNVAAAIVNALMYMAGGR